jgi:hypothetical protein
MTLLQKYGPGMLHGLVAQFAPGIARGALVELLKHQKVNTKIVTEWVQKDRSLWAQIGPDDRESLKKLVAKVNDVSWITSDWAINAVRKDLPAIASLFLGWKKARNWLDRQIEELKRELVS